MSSKIFKNLLIIILVLLLGSILLLGYITINKLWINSKFQSNVSTSSVDKNAVDNISMNDRTSNKLLLRKTDGDGSHGLYTLNLEDNSIQKTSSETDNLWMEHCVYAGCDANLLYSDKKDAILVISGPKSSSEKIMDGMETDVFLQDRNTGTFKKILVSGDISASCWLWLDNQYFLHTGPDEFTCSAFNLTDPAQVKNLYKYDLKGNKLSLNSHDIQIIIDRKTNNTLWSTTYSGDVNNPFGNGHVYIGKRGFEDTYHEASHIYIDNIEYELKEGKLSDYAIVGWM